MVAKGRRKSPRFKGDPRVGWDELEPNWSYLGLFSTWYSKCSINRKSGLFLFLFPKSTFSLRRTVQCAVCIVQCAVCSAEKNGWWQGALCTVHCWWQGVQQDRQRLCARLHAIALPPVAINTKHAKQSHYMHAILFWLIEIAQMCKRSLKMASKKLMFHWKYHWSVISSTGTYMCSGISNGCLRYLKV